MITVPMKWTSYNKEQKSLRISSEFFAGAFPKEFEIISNHTGRTVRFVVDAAKAEACEFWDGEMCVYIPTESLPNVKEAVVYHEY